MFDTIVNGKLNKLLDAGGYSKKETTVLTFDGNTDGKVVLPGSLVGFDEVDFVKVADQAIPGEVCGITIVQNGKNIHYNKNQFTVSDDPVLAVSIDGFDHVISVNESASANVGVDVGTYFEKYTDGSGYVSEVYTETETIVPIDQKYLPGVCLPVVELDTVIENGAVLSESDNAKLHDVFEIGTPVVIVFTIGGYRNTAVFTRFTYPDNAVKAFSSALLSGQVGLLSQENGEFTVVVQ